MKRRLPILLAFLLSVAFVGRSAELEPDVSFAPTAQEASLFTIIDANHDDITWGLKEDTKMNHCNVFHATATDKSATGYGSSEPPFDDWLILPPINFKERGGVYEFSVDASRGTFSNYYNKDEVFEVRIGREATTAAMGTTIMAPVHLTLENNKDGKFKSFSELFTIDEPGVYYIGIHSISTDETSGGCFVANIAVKKHGASATAPGAVESLAATAGRNGELTASVMFYMPDKDMGGKALPSDAVIRAVATCGESSREATGAPGELCTIKDIATKQGVNEITVTTYIGENGGKPATVQVFTGVSIPSSVTSPRCVASDDNLTLRFEWDAPTHTIDNKGVVRPDGNTYTIYEELKNNIMGMDTYYWNKLCELPVDQTYYEVKVPDDGIQRNIRIGVVAANAAGTDSKTLTAISGLGGCPYSLPVIEDFTGCSLTEFNYNPILALEPDESYAGQTWTVNDPYIIDPKYDDDHKPVIIFSNHKGEHARVALPKFSTKGAAAPTARFKIYMGDNTPDLAIYAMAPGTPWKKVSDIVVDRTAKRYRIVEADLGADFADKSWVWLAIDGFFDPEEYCIGFVSEYSITNTLPIDLGVYAFSPEGVIAGNETKYVATVYNPGKNDVMPVAVRWTVSAGERTLAEGESELPSKAIESLSMYDFEWSFTPGVEMIGKASVRFEVEVEGDGDLSNNSATAPVVIKSGGKVVVRDLKATVAEGEGVRLSWTEPMGKMMTEGFETAAAFERLPETICGFTNYDGDRYQCWNLGEKDPIGSAPQAWTVWDGKELTEVFGLPYKAYQGNKYLMVRCPGDELALPPVADDWLISPEVNGNTYVAFMARPTSVLYGDETLDIMVSTTDAEPASFKLYERIMVKPVIERPEEGGEGNLVYTPYYSELPAEARHFALRYASHDAFSIMLDNLEYSPAGTDRGISGYDIYRDGACIAEGVDAAGSYIDAQGNDGKPHAYTVLPLTEGARGGHSNVATVNGSSAIGSAEAEAVSVRGIAGGIAVTTNAPLTVEVYSAAGCLAASASVSGHATIEVPAGFYIVKAGTRSYKVIVK